MGILVEKTGFNTFLKTRAAVVQRVRELLPPEVSRETVGANGKPSLRPLAYATLESSGSGHGRRDTYVLLWRSKQAADTTTQPPPTADCMCPVTVSENGLRVLSADDLREFDADTKAWAWTAPDTFEFDAGAQILGVDDQLHPFQPAATTPKSTQEDGQGATPTAADETAPDWPALLFADCVRHAFNGREAELRGFGADPQFAATRFLSSDAQRAVWPEPVALNAAEVTQLAERLSSGGTLPPNTGLAWQALPFYRGFGILWVRSGDDPWQQWLVCTRELAPSSPRLAWDHPDDRLLVFESQLKTGGLLELNPQTALDYVRFRCAFAGARLIESSGAVPDWVAKHYGEEIRASIGACVRPATPVHEDEKGTVVAVLAEALVDRTEPDGYGLALELWMLKEQTVKHCADALIVNPTAKFPSRSPEHVWPVAVWNLATGLHKPKFTSALAQYQPNSGSEAPDLWTSVWSEQRTAHGIRLSAIQAEYTHIKRMLDDRHAGIVLPDTNDRKDPFLKGTPLDFYSKPSDPQQPLYGLYEFTHKQRVVRFVAYRGADPSNETPLVVLNGKSEPIHKLNAALKIRGELNINRDTVIDYLRFFDQNVHSDLGSFNTIESVDQLKWRFLTDDVEMALSSVPHRIILLDTPSTEYLLLTAFINYGRDLFMALFRVAADGEVVMLEDTPVLTDLPVHPHALDLERDASFVVLG